MFDYSRVDDVLLPLLAWPGSVMFSPVYPANTVKGRICLLHRLDWDKDRLKETSDIYIKPRLIVMASICTIGCLLFYTIHKVNVFVRKFCPSNTTHASIGGRYRRNLITFEELSKFYTFLILYYLFDSFIILMFYITQDIITQDMVFLIYYTVSISFDLLCVILLPLYIIYKSQTDFPVFWLHHTPKIVKFYTTKTGYMPRTELSNNSNRICISTPFNEELLCAPTSVQERVLEKSEGTIPLTYIVLEGELPTENKFQIQRNQEVENKGKTKMKMDEQNISQNMEEIKFPRHLRRKLFFILKMNQVFTSKI